MLTTRRLSSSLAIGLVACAAAAPVASGSEPYAPDARDANAAALAQQSYEDPRTDFRSPDTRDVAQGRGVESAPPVEVVTVHGVRGGFDWGDAGIGAGSVIALVLIGVGASVAVSHRRHHGPSPLVG